MDFITQPLSELFTDINIWVVLGATLLSFLVGGIWYSALFQKAWQEEVGLKEKDMMNGVAMAFGGTFLLSFLSAVLMCFVIGTESTYVQGGVVGFYLSLFVVLAVAINYLYERRTLRLFLINAGYMMLSLIVTGMALGQWL
jgi:hypothetical protein